MTHDPRERTGVVDDVHASWDVAEAKCGLFVRGPGGLLFGLVGKP